MHGCTGSQEPSLLTETFAAHLCDSLKMNKPSHEKKDLSFMHFEIHQPLSTVKLFGSLSEASFRSAVECERTVKALARLRGPEPSLFIYVISTHFKWSSSNKQNCAFITQISDYFQSQGDGFLSPLPANITDGTVAC